MHCYTNEALTAVRGRVLFLGDSITDDGRYVTYLEAWLRLFAPQEDVTLYNLGVSSETLCGLSEAEHPFPRPCVQSRLQRALAEIRPDWVVLCYGMNDAIYHPFSAERLAVFGAAYRDVLAQVAASGAKTIVCTPPPFDAQSFAALGNLLLPEGAPDYSYLHAYEQYTDVLHRYGIYLKEHITEHCALLVDLYTPLAEDLAQRRALDASTLYGDGIHPDLHGHWIIAKTLLLQLFGVQTQYGETVLAQHDGLLLSLMQQRSTLRHFYWKERIGHENPTKSAALPQAEYETALCAIDEQLAQALRQKPSLLCLQAQWNDHPLDCFYFEGFEALVLRPLTPAESNPWVWRTEFFGAFAQADNAMLLRGWHVVHLSIPHLFGSPLAVSLMQRFATLVRARYALAPKAALLGMSRGALYALHYAAACPQSVCALYLDAPVVDVRSWPAGEGEGCGSAFDWQMCQKAHGDSAQPDLFWKKVRAAVRNLTAAHIPLLVVAGDADAVVPFPENAARLLALWHEAGGQASCIIKPGVGHHPHCLDDPAPIVSFYEEARQAAR